MGMAIEEYYRAMGLVLIPDSTSLFVRSNRLEELPGLMRSRWT